MRDIIQWIGVIITAIVLIIGDFCSFKRHLNDSNPFSLFSDLCMWSFIGILIMLISIGISNLFPA